MIWPNDGLRLAMTKIKTRRIRLIIALCISSLLFAGLATVLFTVRGVVSSIKDFSQEGLGARFVINAYEQSDQFNLYQEESIIARAKVLEKEYFASRKAEAKKLGIEYDSSIEIPVVTSFDGPSGKQEILNPSSPAGKKAVAEYFAVNPRPGIEDLKSLAEGYGLVGVYKSQNLVFDDTGSAYLKALEDGEEDYSTDDQNKFSNSYTDISNFANTWQVFDGPLLLPFMLPGQTLAQGSDGSIPILAPYGALERVLGLDSLPASAGSKDRLTRLEEVRSKSAGYTFEVCYRNSTSASRVNQAISQQDELLRNKTNKEYIKPELIYKLPSEACGDVGVERDVRTASAKTLAAKQEQFEQLFGRPAPVSKILTFRIVGVVPDDSNASASSVQQILQSLLSSSVGNGWYTPAAVVDTDPVIRTLFESSSPLSGVMPQYYAELDSADNARKFIDEQNCSPDFSVTFSTPAGSYSDVPNPFQKCKDEGKYFALAAFGSNSIALDEFERGFNKFFRIFVIIVMVIASLILMGIIARIIADSRRETAVFRAIGAKRLDIAQIYLTYVVIICICIATLATLAGALVGTILQSKFGTDARIAASIAFNSTDIEHTFRFSKISLHDLGIVWGVVFAVGGLSSILPLLSNVRRNPINDMRDDR